MRRSAFPVLALAAFLLLLPLVSLLPVSPMSAKRNLAGCRVEPASPERLQAVSGGVPSTTIIPASGPRPHPYPTADLPSADDRTIAAMWATVREAVSCARAGDAPRLYALYTDDVLRRTLGATEPPVNGSGLPDVPVWRGSWVLAEGRVGAVFSEPQPSTRQPMYYVFVKVGDRWLIDAAIPFEQEVAATGRPAA